MVDKIAIVGAGINGLLSAFLVRDSYPDITIDIYDSEQHPVGNMSHRGVTHGSRDARHITGSESIGFESSIHPDALRNHPGHDIPGWLLKDEDQLSSEEINWREEFESTYTGSNLLNQLDYEHAELNYKGLAAWCDLAKKYPFIQRHVISSDGIEVYFEDKNVFDDDMVMETDFCDKYYPTGSVRKDTNNELDKLYSEKLVVPGMSIRIKSLAEELIQKLENDTRVTFHWGVTVKSAKELEVKVIVWTSGVTHKQPNEHREHNVQGLIGCWATIQNQGLTKPFKIATPAPSAYINFTPDGENIHVSGGFGWSGNYVDMEAQNTLGRPIADHFIEQVNKYLESNITVKDIAYCIRPSTPRGQPLLKTTSVDGIKSILISGSAKSGTTHAPALSEYVLKELV